MEQVTIEGVDLFLCEPDEVPMKWVGQPELVTQVLAAWLVVEKSDLPLAPRLVGKPGVGKTTLAYHSGRALGREVYLFQATMDTRPEDLIVTPVISERGKIKYMASSVVSAMIKGGVAVIDEGNRMSEKSWASLAPLLDSRRYVESVVAGIKIKAHPAFRLCTTLNDDASTFELPEYIHSRLQPQIYIDFPERDEELLIMKSNLPFAEDEVLEYVVEFLQAAHEADERYSVRDGINIARYALKRIAETGETLETEERRRRVAAALKEAAAMILDRTAAEYFSTLMADLEGEA
jgi:MoxR-like ATPase